MFKHSRTAAEAAQGLAGQVVVFNLGDEEYALPIHHVREVIRYTRPRRVSGDPRVLGVISLRDRLVPVVDVARGLGLEVTPNAGLQDRHRRDRRAHQRGRDRRRGQ